MCVHMYVCMYVPRYLDIVSELLLTVRQMENTLNKRRVTARRGSRAGAGDQGPSDQDKIMMQVLLYVCMFFFFCRVCLPTLYRYYKKVLLYKQYVTKYYLYSTQILAQYVWHKHPIIIFGVV